MQKLLLTSWQVVPREQLFFRDVSKTVAGSESEPTSLTLNFRQAFASLCHLASDSDLLHQMQSACRVCGLLISWRYVGSSILGRRLKLQQRSDHTSANACITHSCPQSVPKARWVLSQQEINCSVRTPSIGFQCHAFTTSVERTPRESLCSSRSSCSTHAALEPDRK